MIKKIYPQESATTHNLIYLDLYQSLSSGDDQVSISYKEAFFGKNNRGATWISIFLALSQVMSGINIIFIYAKDIFADIIKNGGDSNLSASMMAFILGSVSLVGNVMGNYTVKMLSRRFMFISGHALCGLFLALFAFTKRYNNGNIVLACACLFNVFFQASSGGGFWVYAGEVASAKASSVCVFLMMSMSLV
jgi:predicted MFS family arabinose efflux permease